MTKMKLKKKKVRVPKLKSTICNLGANYYDNTSISDSVSIPTCPSFPKGQNLPPPPLC